MTSQSIQTVRSPSLAMSMTARSARPMMRWISCVRPPTFPLADSRWVRSCVARGSMAYSALTQPTPRPLSQAGTRSSIVAAHNTRVFPTEISALPSAYFKKPGSITTGRRSSARRPSERIIPAVFHSSKRDASCALLDGHGLREVAGLVDVLSFDIRDVIRQELQWNDVDDRRE